jgi:hypothetical protein
VICGMVRGEGVVGEVRYLVAGEMVNSKW